MNRRNLKLAPQDSTLDAIAQVADSIAIERESVERGAIELLKKGRDREALKVLRKHWNIPEPKLRRVK